MLSLITRARKRIEPCNDLVESYMSFVFSLLYGFTSYILKKDRAMDDWIGVSIYVYVYKDAEKQRERKL